MNKTVNRLIWKLLSLLAMVCLMACGGEETTKPIDPGQDSSLTGACTLASDLPDCGACFSGTSTCNYGEISVTDTSCQNCQVLNQLYTALCDAGITDSLADIEAGIECSEPTQ
ncbi:MAG: hypothetical protein HOI23_03725 [Deltaproteobacteria bacterium]|jgi:hypothetical protein|nr:hypothetical protein [Deltaproteobacteria bacterium]